MTQNAYPTDWTPDDILPGWESREKWIDGYGVQREYRRVCPVCGNGGVENCVCPGPVGYCPENTGVAVSPLGYLRWNFEQPAYPAPMETYYYADYAGGDVGYVLYPSSGEVEVYLGDLSSTDGWYPAGAARLTMIKNASGSDYSGDTCERSNFEYLREWYWGEGPGKLGYLWPVYGGHGSYGILIDLTRLYRDRRDIASELRSDLDRLAQYPILDEDRESELRMAGEEEAWDSWARREAEVELGKRFPFCEELFDSRELLRQDFEIWMDMENCYWEPQTGSDMYVDVRRVCASVDVHMLVEAGYGTEAEHIAARMLADRGEL